MHLNRLTPIFVVLVIMGSMVFCKESEKMNFRNDGVCTPAEWLEYIQSVVAQQKSGTFLVHDNKKSPVIIEWKKIGMMQPDFAESMQKIEKVACRAYTRVEMKFLRTFPAVVYSEPFLKPLQALFSCGTENVEWAKAEIIMKDIVKSHFVFDLEQFSTDIRNLYIHDICFFIVVRDQLTGDLLGFATYMIRANYKYGDAKLMTLGVDPLYQGRGLGKLLISSIFAIVPNIQRIFLCTRVTNEGALGAYRSWGFVTDNDPVMDYPFNGDHWSFLEYNAQACSTLQKVAKTYIE